MPTIDKQEMTSEEPSPKPLDKLMLLPLPIELIHQNPYQWKKNDEARILRAEDWMTSEDGETVLKPSRFWGTNHSEQTS